MGIAILGVSVLHGLAWSGFGDSVLAKVLSPFARIAFTDGFLFLSGFGLFFSYTKRNDVFQFYRKRFFRLVVPFMIMSLPFLVYRLVCEDMPFGDFLLHETALWFWFFGNDGMWYISVSMFLYLIFPFVYMFIFKGLNNKDIWLKGIVVIFAMCVLNAVLYCFFSDYYELTRIGISKFPIFVIGMLFGYMAVKKVRLGVIPYFLIGGGILTLIYFLKNKGEFFNAYYEIVYKLIMMPLVCIFFNVLNEKGHDMSVAIRFFEWLGKYSLEIYVLQMLLFTFVSSLVDNQSQIMVTLITFVSVFVLCLPIHVLIGKWIDVAMLRRRK